MMWHGDEGVLDVDGQGSDSLPGYWTVDSSMAGSGAVLLLFDAGKE